MKLILVQLHGIGVIVTTEEWKGGFIEECVIELEQDNATIFIEVNLEALEMSTLG